MLDLTRKLCSLPGVSSREEAVREFIAQTIRPYVKWMKVDAMGNLIAFKEGKKHTGSKLLLDAHMDEVGVMVTGYTEQGCLRFAFVGGVDRRVVIGKRVYLGKERILGSFRYETHPSDHQRGTHRQCPRWRNCTSTLEPKTKRKPRPR